MWYEYEDDEVIVDKIDYDEVKEDLIWLQQSVDDVMGQDVVRVFLATMTPYEYEVAFESDLLPTGPIFEYDVDSLRVEIQNVFPDYDWSKFDRH